MKNPVVFLLQFIAWLMLITVVAATWAGVTYPNGRAKAYSNEFSKIHPMCIHRVLIDDRYEASVNLEICHAEYKKHPITLEKIRSTLGEKTLMRVSATTESQDGGEWIIGYSFAEDDADQSGPFLINLFTRSPDEVELSSLAGVSHDNTDNTLTAHFLEGTGDRCQGGYVQLMGMASRQEIALSQASTLYALLNPLGQLLKREGSAVRTSFPEWKAGDVISDAPTACVGRLIGVYDHVSKSTTVNAVAVDYDALLRQSRNATEACIADAIVRAKNDGSFQSGPYTVYGLDHWNNVLGYVHQRCGTDQAFNPINRGI